MKRLLLIPFALMILGAETQTSVIDLTPQESHDLKQLSDKVNGATVAVETAKKLLDLSQKALDAKEALVAKGYGKKIGYGADGRCNGAIALPGSYIPTCSLYIAGEFDKDMKHLITHP